MSNFSLKKTVVYDIKQQSLNLYNNRVDQKGLSKETMLSSRHSKNNSVVVLSSMTAGNAYDTSRNQDFSKKAMAVTNL